MKRIHFIVTITSVAFAFAMLLSGCKSSRKATKEGTDGKSEGSVTTVTTPKVDKLTRNTVAKVEAHRQKAKGIRGKANVSLGSLSANGPIKMKRDEIIQVSLSALLGLMEVGRLELTPDYFYFLDRINRQYVKASWEDVTPFREAGINFYTFQAFFWNELFVPGSKGTPQASDFKAQEASEYYVLTPSEENKDSQFAIAVRFLINMASGNIKQTSIVPVKNQSLSLYCIYNEWTKLDKKAFPSDISIATSAHGKSNTIRLRFSNLEIDEDMGDIYSSNPSSSYKAIDINKMFEQLGK